MKTKFITLLVLLPLSLTIFANEENKNIATKQDYLRIEVYTHRSYQLNFEKKFNPFMKSYFSEQIDKHRELHQRIKLLGNSDYRKDIHAPLHSVSYSISSEIDGKLVSIKLYKRAESEIESAREWIKESEKLYKDTYRVITEYGNIE